MTSKSEIRVAIAGVGNCCSSFIQGLTYYTNNNENTGLRTPLIGGYSVDKIIPVLGIDIDTRKVGKDLSEAIQAPPNNTPLFQKVPFLNAPVIMGNILDGVSPHMTNTHEPCSFEISTKEMEDIVKLLQDNKVDVLINLLPTGSQKATEFYAQSALNANCAFVNCIPTFISSDPIWIKKFEEKKLPVLGDDIKSQLGATWLHRSIVQSFLDRGIKIVNTSQENYGGNTDFKNMLNPERIKFKLKSKRSSIEHLISDHKKGGYTIPPVYAGPGSNENNHGFKEELKDNKKAHITIEGKGFGGQKITASIDLSVFDSPNSAGIIIDAIRCAQSARDKKEFGAIPVSSFLFKHPFKKINDSKALDEFEQWI